VAKACGCSVQFISNIEHGRAPLPWDKVGTLAAFLQIPVDSLQAANLSIRSDFKSFVSSSTPLVTPTASRAGVRGKRVAMPAVLAEAKHVNEAASTVALTALSALSSRDDMLVRLLQRYQDATPTAKKRFVKAALKLF